MADTKTMTLAEAKVYIKDPTDFTHYDEAYDIISRYEPSFFDTLQGKEKNDGVTRALEMYDAVRTFATYEFDDYVAINNVAVYLSKHKHPKAIEADRLAQKFWDELDNSDEIKDAASLAKNIQDINAELSNNSWTEMKRDRRVSSWLAKIDLEDDLSDGDMTPADVDKTFNSLFDSACQSTLTSLSKNKNFMMKNSESKKNILNSFIYDRFSELLKLSILDSNPMSGNKKFASKEEFLESLNKHAKKLFATGKKVTLRKSSVMNATVVVNQQMEDLTKELAAKGNKLAAEEMEKSQQKFYQRMISWGNDAWKQRDMIAKGIKNSKWRLAITGFGGIAVALATPQVSTAKGAYLAAGFMGFVGISSFVWPLLEKQTAAKNAALERGDTETAAQFKKKDLISAYKMMNKDEKKRYWQRAIVTSLLGLGGAVAIYGAAHAGQGENVATMATELLKTRLEVAAVRGISLTAMQGGFAWQDQRQASADANKALIERTDAAYERAMNSKKRAQIGWVATIATVVAAGIGEWIGYNRLSSKTSQNVTASLMSKTEDPALLDTLKTQRDSSLVEKVLAQKGDTVYTQKGDSIFMKLKNFVLGTKDSSGDPKHTGAMEALKAAADQDANLKAENAALEHFFGKDTNGNPRLPMEYEDGLGVNKTQFNTIRNQLGKLLAQQKVADAAGTEVANPDKLYADAVRNVAVYLNEHPEIANGKNPIQMIEQVLHRHRLSLGHFNEKIVVEGEGTFGVSRKVGGQWVYGDPSFNKDMNAWFDIMCDGKPKEEGADLMAPLANLAKDQELASATGNGNRVVVNDCDVTLVRYGAKHKINVSVPPVKDDLPPEQQPTGAVAGEDKTQIVEQPTGPVAGDDKVEQPLKPAVRVVTYDGISVGNPNDIAPGTGRAKKIGETIIISGKPDPTELLLNSKKQIIK